MMRCFAISLADWGFEPIGERNPVRWYVEDGTGYLRGPYESLESAEFAAEELNRNDE